MANFVNNSNAPKKADVIIKEVNDISSKQDSLSQRIARMEARLNSALDELKNQSVPNQIDEIFALLKEEYAAIRTEIKYLAAQNEQIYLALNDNITSLTQQVEAKQSVEIDYELLAQKIAEHITIPEASASPIDEEEFADKVAVRVSALWSDDFDIVVDDEGCASISRELADRFDYDEMASRLSEKIQGPSLNEEVIAEKAAEILSNYLPDPDTEEIAEKVAEKVASADHDHDYNIVIDEEGLETVAQRVRDKVCGSTDPRFDNVDGGIDEIKNMLLLGAVVGAAAEEEHAEENNEAAEEEALVTVSAVIEDEEQEPEEEAQGGVDFANMMKYNRSFMARIIQGTDEQKNYYGSVKNALLSYKKVNSNIAWGAERFHKGRETIARMKIRGKTLCLYLALDPSEYSTSVYHHTDVSDNKSMSGTPMLVKIKSPRGVKKAVRLIDEMLVKRDGIKTVVAERDYAAMYPYETMEELIEEGLVKDVGKDK